MGRVQARAFGARRGCTFLHFDHFKKANFVVVTSDYKKKSHALGARTPRLLISSIYNPSGATQKKFAVRPFFTIWGEFYFLRYFLKNPTSNCNISTGRARPPKAGVDSDQEFYAFFACEKLEAYREV